ncbi:TetR/AcrR family transcriptional regulator [Nocardia blacklockiae]|uniref:TetR/AcrR family transcriptional regulator n=1 Tax=Nocardia blacklockiae TaxID=480036 RepID=UPI0018946226|nr:TetR/AcrR family transcriptional regulator [Nocardia blacklockiae]MBF6175051.1 TetR/AcrR family transcriptional regulator [Nocardia blacklockiae]
MVVKRRYESAHRQDQARRTRLAVLDAARTLFVSAGYGATTLAAVAREAGVAVQTVYKIFGNKKTLLSDLVDVTIAGDDEPTELARRQFVDDIRALGDARAKLARYATHLASTHAREAEIMLAVESAAAVDRDAADILRKNREERRAGMTMFAADLAETGELRPDYSRDMIVDVLWLAMDVRNFEWLVRQRGWSPAQFERWYVESVAAAILVEGGK